MSLQVRSVRLGPVSFRARPRTWLVAALAWGIALAGAIAVLFSGSVNMTPEQFWAALAGVGERADMLLLWEFRMPRAVTGLVVGACLGTAGCLFQALSRNALGSPEIIGLTGGAALGAVASVIVFRSFGWGTAVGAIIGCLGAALLTWVLSPRGFGGGNRLILIGLGVASLIQPVTVLLLTRADSDSATSARLWLTGTLNARNWSHAAVGAVLFAVILPFALLISRHLDAAEAGEMRGEPLHVEQAPGAVGAQLVDEADERRLRRVTAVPRVVEHGLAGEEPAHTDTVEPADQAAPPVPGLDGVHPAALVELGVDRADVLVDPAVGTRGIGAAVEHPCEGPVDARRVAPERLAQAPADVQPRQRKDPPTHRRPPADALVAGLVERHREDAGGVGGQGEIGVEPGGEADEILVGPVAHVAEEFADHGPNVCARRPCASTRMRAVRQGADGRLILSADDKRTGPRV